MQDPYHTNCRIRLTHCMYNYPLPETICGEMGSMLRAGTLCWFSRTQPCPIRVTIFTLSQASLSISALGTAVVEEAPLLAGTQGTIKRKQIHQPKNKYVGLLTTPNCLAALQTQPNWTIGFEMSAEATCLMASHGKYTVCIQSSC